MVKSLYADGASGKQELKMPGRYRAWVGKGGDGPGIALDAHTGEMIEMDKKPDESEFVPYSRYNLDERGMPREVKGSEFSPMNTSQERAQFMESSPGGTIDRRAKHELEMRKELAGRMGAKEKADTANTSYGYSPQQEKQLQALRNSRAKIEQGLSQGDYTPDQASRLTSQISIQEKAILPQLQKKPPTPEQEFMARTFTDPLSGKRYVKNSKGDFSLLEGQRSQKEENEARKQVFDMLTVEQTDIEGKTTGWKYPTMEEVSQGLAALDLGTAKSDGAKGGMQGGPGQPDPKEKLEPEPLGMTERFKAGLVELEDQEFGRASKPAMTRFGKTFVAEAAAKGMKPAEAVKTFMDLWRAERKKKGMFRDDVVPNPSKFKIESLKESAERGYLEYLMRLKEESNATNT